MEMSARGGRRKTVHFYMNDERKHLKDQRTKAALEVVLVSTRNPLNIGAAARAMANFGVKRLTVVAPFEKSWREARSAIEAEDLLVGAREVGTLAEALTEATLVLGTGTSRYRKPEQEYFLLPGVRERVRAELERGGRVAVVFGSEKHGLTREELSLCHALVEIPTDAGQPSMNLGQAVAVCLYELTRARDGAGVVEAGEEREPVRAGDLERLGELILEVAERARYSPALMRGANQEDLRLMLRRWQLSPGDLRRAMGLFRRIEWQMERGEGSGGKVEGKEEREDD